MSTPKPSLRAEQRALLARMQALGQSRQQIARELSRRFGLRPRAAWRHAHGWSLRDAADQINSRASDTGLDASGNASMTAAHLCEYENWPGHGPKPTGRRPTPLVLALLAATYDTPAVHDLLDFADYEHMSPGDRLVLAANAREGDQAGVDSGLQARRERPPLTRLQLPGRRDASHLASSSPAGSNSHPEPPDAEIPPVLAPLAAVIFSTPGPSREIPAARLADETVRIWKLRQAARYQKLIGDLPLVLAMARGNGNRSETDRRPAQLAALTHLYNATSSLAKALGALELAGIAADRAVQAADRTGDPLLAGAAAYRMANVLLSAGHLRSARLVAISAGDRLRPVMTATASHTSMWGALLATAAQAAARERSASEAWELLGSSKVAADLLTSEQADLFSIFGPASWLIHAVSIAADLDDGAEAVRRATQIPAGRLPRHLSERRTFLLLGKARGYALCENVAAATDALLEAERAAPEEIRHNPEARSLVSRLLPATSGHNGPLLELAARMSQRMTLAISDGG